MNRSNTSATAQLPQHKGKTVPANEIKKHKSFRLCLTDYSTFTSVANEMIFLYSWAKCTYMSACLSASKS